MSDYIKRLDAKLRIFEYGVRHRDDCSIASACENLERQVNAIPAADVVERKRGRCLPKARYFYCSECGYAVDDIYEEAYYPDDEKVFVFEKGESWHFCPNCGAEMQEDGES